MSKEEILDTLENFKDEYGTSFSNTERETVNKEERNIYIWKMRNEGHTIREISRAVGLTRQRVEQIIEEMARKKTFIEKERHPWDM